MICTGQQFQTRLVGMVPTFYCCIPTKTLSGALSSTKDKSTDQIGTQLSTIFMEKVMYTYFWMRLP